MSEFKGTKGKWYSEYKSGYWKITDDEREGSIADVYFFNDEKDTAEYNAKIIEKAPEMLEMLQRFYNGHHANYPEIHIELGKLIRSATEL